MNILVTGGTGTVGSQVVRELLTRGAQVHVLTRDAAKAQKLPAGVQAVTGDLGTVESVKRVFKGMDGVFLVNTVSPTEIYEGLLSVCALRNENVKRLVYLSVHHADAAAWLPHFGGKIGVEEAVKKCGVPATILRPNNFYQNDYWFKDALLQHGVYPQPIGDVGCHRVDVRDIAEAAAIALTAGGHEGQTYDLVGPEAHTGATTAATWSRALGKPIAYGGNDLEAWEKQSLQYMPDWAVFDFKHMYDLLPEVRPEGARPRPSSGRRACSDTRRARSARSSARQHRRGRRGEELLDRAVEHGAIDLARFDVAAAHLDEGLGRRRRVEQPPAVRERHDGVLGAVQEQQRRADGGDPLDGIERIADDQPNREHRVAFLPDPDDRVRRPFQDHRPRLDLRRQVDGDRGPQRPAEDDQLLRRRHPRACAGSRTPRAHPRRRFVPSVRRPDRCSRGIPAPAR